VKKINYLIFNLKENIMKRTLFTFVALLAFISVIGQNVPRKFVCMEIETSIWCVYCPGAAMGAEDLLANGKSVAVIENHCNGLGTDTYANPGSLSRESMYFGGSNGYPTATFDGTTGIVGGNATHSMYANYLPLYNARIAVDAPIDISMTFSNTGLHYNVTVTVTKVGTVSATSLKLYFFVTESNIRKNWENQKWLHFVNRLMVPDKNGTTVDFTSGNTQVYNLSLDMDASWVTKNCEFVATVQDMDASQGSFINNGSTVMKREEIQTIKSGLLPFAVDFNASIDHVALYDTVQFAAACTGGYVNCQETYLWSFPGAVPSSSTDSMPTVQYTESGAHDVTLIANRGGQIDTLTKTAFIYVGGVGVKEQAGNDMRIYPNPNQGGFSVSFNVQKSFVGDITLMDMNGKTVYSENGVTINNNMTKTFRLGNIPAGQYFLEVKNNDQKIVKKVMIN
jgi:PKD repeat protein